MRGGAGWPLGLQNADGGWPTFCRGWGRDKVIWATDYPLLSFERSLSELEALGLSEEILAKLVRDNALAAFGLQRPVEVRA